MKRTTTKTTARRESAPREADAPAVGDVLPPDDRKTGAPAGFHAPDLRGLEGQVAAVPRREKTYTFAPPRAAAVPITTKE